MSEIDMLKKRIAELERENLRLRTGAAVTVAAGGVTRSDATAASMTVAGIEEMVLLVAADGTFSYVNGPMGKLLGMTDRKAELGRPLAHWDRIPGAEGVLASLAEMARDGEGLFTIEPPLADFPQERLPDPDAKRPNGPIYLRLTAFRAGEKVQISIQETTRLRWLERSFSRYLPQKVIEQLQFMSHEEIMRPQRATLTLLFADLRGFTAVAEQLDPGQVSGILSSFLGEMTAVINELDGTVSQFVGDEVFAIFGAPQKQPDHALRALIAGVRMLESHERWRKERMAKGLPAPLVGIGIDTGDVVIGNIGTLERSEYTAVGNAVNLASRLCSGAPGGFIYTTPETYEAASQAFTLYHGPIPVPRLNFDQMGEMSFKNVSRPVNVLSVRSG